MAVTSNEYSRAIFVKRKRVDEPLDALMIDLPSQSKRYRGSEGQGMFTLAETMTEDPSLLDDQKAKDLHKRLAMIHQSPRASPQVNSPAVMPLSPKTTTTPHTGPREFKVLRTSRAARSVVDAAAPSAAAAGAPVPIPIPIPGQTLPVSSVDAVEDTSTRFVLYEAVPSDGPVAASGTERVEDPTPEMQEFQDMLSEYLSVNEISLDAPAPRKPVTSTALAGASKKLAEEDDDEEEYVWDVFYQRQNLSGDLSVWDGLANVGTLSGLPPTEGDILADEEDSDSVKDEADEDSNEEDFYRNDYPDTESDDSDVYQSDGDHEWR